MKFNSKINKVALARRWDSAIRWPPTAPKKTSPVSTQLLAGYYPFHTSEKNTNWADNIRHQNQKTKALYQNCDVLYSRMGFLFVW